jgi:hypothetical protein
MLSLNLLFAIRSLLPPGNESFHETVIAASLKTELFGTVLPVLSSESFIAKEKQLYFLRSLDMSIVSNMLANLFSMILQRVNIYLPRAGVGF